MKNTFLKRELSIPAVLLLAGVLFLSACSGPTATAQVPSDALYKNAAAPVEQRVEDLLKRMTVREKIGQMTQIVKDVTHSGDIRDLTLGSVLSGGGGSPADNTATGWANMVDSYQKEALSTRLGIPMIYGVDSVHGHNNLKGATIFPHNIALGAAGDADLVKRIGVAVAEETAATGVLWTFSPCVAVGRDPRWGRFYESYGQDPVLVTALGSAFIQGFQSASTGTAAKTAATAKHFLGDGGTGWGTPTTNNYKIDQGDTKGDDAYLRSVLLPPYAQAVKDGVRTVMVSFSSWNGLKMHAQKDLITGILKKELGFTGFVVSDWAGMDQINPDYYTAMVTGINSGVDMNMVPYEAGKFMAVVEKAVAAKDISMDRIDDAVRRILRVKFEMGLFEAPLANRALASTIRSADHLALAREAVAKSQVVLKNLGVLPLKKNAAKMYVAGNAANDIGIQCGGWTMSWQGKAGAITAGTTIVDGIKEKITGGEVIFDAYANFEKADRKAVCVVVVGETPYAEGVGDSETIALTPGSLEVIKKALAQFDKVVVVLVSGRTLVLDSSVEQAAALVAAWLPGTEGAGVADVLFGDVKPTGKLAFDWPKSVDQLPLGRFISGEQKPLYPVGYGLMY